MTKQKIYAARHQREPYTITAEQMAASAERRAKQKKIKKSK